ncbi:lysozyme inhibitor LprI family protein [[Pseudomonas] boreopolis]|uniref:lysozyme inhibitor LprI family protein n=1 Tax=Xanthomonas boreopolis TaxID=86183 RepID=UPI003D9BDB50
MPASKFFLFALLAASASAHAESTLSVVVLDQARQGDKAALLLHIHDEASPDPAEPGADGWMPPPQACRDGGAGQDANQSRRGCFGFAIDENGRDIAPQGSRILYSGVADSYVLLVYRTPFAKEPVTRVHVDVENFGYHNGGEAGRSEAVAWQAGTLDVHHPLRRLFALQDGLLNEDYQAIVGQLGDRDADIARVRAEQRQWLKVTDANCGARAPDEPSWEEDFLRCRLRFIERRLAQFALLARELDIPYRDDPE